MRDAEEMMKQNTEEALAKAKPQGAGRFDYVAYDEYAQRGQMLAKAHVEKFEAAINNLPDGRYKSLALTALEECYCWVGKAIRDEQVKRNGSAQLQEGRNNG